MDLPTISVSMGTYNGERYLEEQLDSLASQSHLPCELQIGDDGSSDSTLEIVEKFARNAPFPVDIRRNDVRLGYGENFMATARRCSGDWIAFCDQDDVWLPHKLARCVEVIRGGDPSLVLVVHNATVTDSDLGVLGPLDGGPFGSFDQFSLSPHYLAHGFREVFKREPILRLSNGPGRGIGWIPDPLAHDNWVSVVASLTGSVVSLSESLVYWRRHENTATVRPSPDVLTTAEGLMRNNGEVYRKESEAFLALAEYLRKYGCLERAVEVVSDHANILELRSRIYLGGNRIQRFIAFWQLFLSGSYFGVNGWRLSTRSAAKDLIYSLR
jgi:rhamnosyltransferase